MIERRCHCSLLSLVHESVGVQKKVQKVSARELEPDDIATPSSTLVSLPTICCDSVVNVYARTYQKGMQPCSVSQNRLGALNGLASIVES